MVWGVDGERLAPYLRHSVEMRVPSRPGMGDGFDLGLVTRVHHKDDETSISGSYAEYDVLLVAHLSVYEMTHIPTLGFHKVSDSGDYAILRAATSLPDIANVESFYQSFMDSDGDLVVVGYVADRFPVIFGTANHLRAGNDTALWHTDSTEGEVRVVHHKNSFAKMKEDGKMQVEIKDEQELLITLDGTQIMKLFWDGGNLKIEIGSGGSLEDTLLAETFRTWWNANIANHTHSVAGILDDNGDALVGGSVTGPMGENFDNNSLSNKVKNY